MLQAIQSKPFLIKPNHHELEILTNKKLKSIEQIATEARLIANQGTQFICVSLAEKGAILTGPENSYYCNSPAIKVHSTVGAGDSMVAGLAYSFSKNHSAEQALKFAVACGAGTAIQTGTQLFHTNKLTSLSEQITIKILDI